MKKDFSKYVLNIFTKMLNQDCLYHIVPQLSDTAELYLLKCVDRKWNEWLNKKEAIRECNRWSHVFDSIHMRFAKFFKRCISLMKKYYRSDIVMYTGLLNIFSHIEENLIIMNIFNSTPLWKVVYNKLNEIEQTCETSDQRRFYFDLLIEKFKPLKDRIYFNHLPRHPVYGVMQYPRYFERDTHCNEYFYGTKCKDYNNMEFDEFEYDDLLDISKRIIPSKLEQCWKSCFGDYYKKMDIDILNYPELHYILFTLEAIGGLSPSLYDDDYLDHGLTPI